MKYITKILIYDSSGSILLLQRSNTHPIYSLHDDLPGGVVEPNESVEIATIREVQEETNLVLNSADLDLLFSKTTPSGKQFLLFSSKLEIAEPPVNISWEHVDYSWVTTEEFIAREQPAGADYTFLAAQKHLRDN